MRLRSPALRFAASCVALCASSVATADWQEIPVNSMLLAELFGAVVTGDEDRAGFISDGVMRFPGCSEGPQPLFDADGNQLDTPLAKSIGTFSFFVDLGDDGRLNPGGNLLVYLSGGGACWDAATCVGSALTPTSTYFPATFESADALNLAKTADSSGILAVRDDNPYADFDKVYIPYCTGDVHVGSSDTTYKFDPLVAFGAPTADWTIRHRGFDNLLVALEWLQRKMDDVATPLGKVTIVGSSAGGYGALINFPVIRNALGEGPSYSIILDSSNGVLTNGFLDQAFGPLGEEGIWKARQNIPRCCGRSWISTPACFG